MSEPAADALFPERFVPEEMHGLIEAEHLVRYRWASSYVDGCTVLDAGCGVGYGSLLLKAAGATHVTGVDIAKDAVEAARAQAVAGVEFRRGDIAELPLEDASCDIAVCFEAIEHVHDQPRTLDELRRALTPAGLLVISSPNRDVYQGGNPHHTHEYTPAELLDALSERFANVRLMRQQAWLVSMICDDGTLGEADPARPLDLALHKLSGVEPGKETFTLALASDGQLPDPPMMAMATDLHELADWRDRARSAEEHLRHSEQATRDAGDSYASAQQAYVAAQEAYMTAQEAYATAQAAYENALGTIETLERGQERDERALSRTSTLLAERNAALRLAAAELTALRTQAAELEAKLAASSASLEILTSSKSWRITAPLRALGRLGHRR
jgi:SAM-dependent methyltransferase